MVTAGSVIRLWQHYDAGPFSLYCLMGYTPQAQITYTSVVSNVLKPVDQQYVTLSCDTDGNYASGYRSGFNGMQKDEEIKGRGNSLDFGARIYDGRLGRFLSVDPLSAKYPYASPYGFVNNSPIRNVEVDGKYWLDFVECDFTYKHAKQHGGPYIMVTNVHYGFTNSEALKALNIAGAVPAAPEISWTATASKFIMALKDNSVNFGASDWAGVLLNIFGAKAGKYLDDGGRAALDLYLSGVAISVEELQQFKETDYYQLYLDERGFEILKQEGVITDKGFDRKLLEQWHKQGIKKLESGDKAFQKKYRVGEFGGTSSRGAPAAYVRGKVEETIQIARTKAAEELDKKVANGKAEQ